MTTINQHIESLQTEFRKLAKSTQKRISREATRYCNANPSMADANGFWRGLSARQVIAAAAATAKVN